jgi:ferredoxin
VVCPFGVINELAAKWSKAERLFPRALRGLWIATLLFVLLTWADEQLGIIRSPRMTAALIVALSAAALATGLYYQRRSFCRYLCPITGLQGVYSMMSPVELRAADRSICGKECRQSCYRGTQAGSGCPMLEFPMSVDRNNYCNFCFECVKTCPSNNIALRFRSFGADLWSSFRHTLDESYLALALVGVTTIVTAQMLSDWGKWISALSRMLPLEVRAAIRPVTYLTLTETLLFFFVALVLVPSLGYLAAWSADRLSGGERAGARKFLVVLGYMFIPIGLAMHLAHNVSHLLLEGAGVLPAFQRVLALIWGGMEEIDWHMAPLIDPPLVHALQMGLILIGFIFSMVAGIRLAMRYLGPTKSGKALTPFIALALLFTLVNLYMLHQPMGMRHGM